ncbi:MAG: DUF998 domain-containing protein, partial [Candidatus Bathyarchaeota archaeon]
GISGVISSTVPLAMILVSTVLEGSFSWNKNALSDIGVSSQAWLFNSALVVGGLLNLLFVFGLRNYLGKTRCLKIGVLLLLVSNISLSLVGVFTENYDIVHGLVALGYLLLTPCGLICIGLGEKRRELGKVSLVLGITALLAIFGLPMIVFVANLQIGFAVPEFAESLVLSIWTFWVSLKLIRFQVSNEPKK